MKYLKLFESFNEEDIHSIFRKYGIEDYTINSDGTVDVNGSVNLYNKGLTKLPLKFGRVSGNFICGSNKLTSLWGCPKEVRGSFYCNNNKLTSLEGCPKEVGGSFNYTNNKLVSFEGPRVIRGEFWCDGNPVWTIWNMISVDDEWDYHLMERFIDYDIIQDGVVILDRLNCLLEEIGKDPVTKVKGYKVL